MKSPSVGFVVELLNQGRMVQVGETNVYNLSFSSVLSESIQTVRIVLEKNGYFFEYSTADAIDQVYRVDHSSCVKSYPTASMYDEARRAEAEKTARAAAEERAKIEAEMNSEWSGTGFALNNGFVVTNHHVIDGAKKILVHMVDGNPNSTMTAEIVAKDESSDLAILKINDNKFTGFGKIPYSISILYADVGEKVWTLGYPLTQYLGNEIKLADGLISSKSGYHGNISTYQITVPVQPENSGGPLFDSKGNIVGIVNASVQGAENVGYAIKTTFLETLSESYSLAQNLPSSNTIASLALKDQVKKVEKFIFLIECSAKSDNSSSSISWQSGESSSSSSSTRSYGGSNNTVTTRSVSLVVGEKIRLTPITSTNATFESDDDEVFVTKDGVVTGIKPSTAYVWEHGKGLQLITVNVRGFY
ncbi:MAG: trypsin-like serine protease [Bacteroidales bacterium]|nr:trypsin-like serine protease [Bacteroidales bacterium]